MLLLLFLKHAEVKAHISDLDERVFFFVLEVVYLGPVRGGHKDLSRQPFLLDYNVIVKSIVDDVARHNLDDLCARVASRAILENDSEVQVLLLCRKDII